MNNFNRGKLFFIKFCQVLISILFFLFLIFVIKWRIDTLYLKSITTKNVKIGIVEEVKKTYGDLLIATGLRKEKFVKPVVLVDDDKKDEKDENVNNFTVPEGTNLDSLGELLISKGLIKDLPTYKALAEDMQIQGKIVPGAYDFDKGMKVKEILAEIAGIELKPYKLNIGEGEGPAQVGKKLLDLGAIKSDQAFIAECNRLGVTAFAPGDHEFTMPTKVENIIKTLTQK